MNKKNFDIDMVDDIDALKEYRKIVIAAEQKSQDDFDKTLIALSSGSLGISFAFVKDIIGTKQMTHSYYLLYAWTFWGLSLACILISFYFSHQSLRYVIRQIDNKRIYNQKPGGVFSTITFILNIGSGISFIVGLILLIIFAFYNLG
jgi:hypothetical protein